MVWIVIALMTLSAVVCVVWPLSDGHDAEGWLKLVRAYTVLGETDKAKGALADARRNLASDAGSLARLEGLARELGLEGQG